MCQGQAHWEISPNHHKKEYDENSSIALEI